MRGITHAVRSGKGPFGNLSVGGSSLAASYFAASYFAALPVIRKVHGTRRDRRRQASGQ